MPAGGGGAGPRPTPPSHLLPWSTFERTLGAHGEGAQAGRPPSLHKALGRPQTKRETDRRGWVGGRYWLLPAGACRPWYSAGGALPLPHPPCGSRPSTRYFNLRTTRCLRSTASSNSYPPMAGRFTVARAWGRGASIPAYIQGGGRGRRDLNNWPRAFKTKLKPSGGGSNPFPPGLQTAEGGE